MGPQKLRNLTIKQARVMYKKDKASQYSRIQYHLIFPKNFKLSNKDKSVLEILRRMEGMIKKFHAHSSIISHFKDPENGALSESTSRAHIQAVYKIFVDPIKTGKKADRALAVNFHKKMIEILTNEGNISIDSVRLAFQIVKEISALQGLYTEEEMSYSDIDNRTHIYYANPEDAGLTGVSIIDIFNKLDEIGVKNENTQKMRELYADELSEHEKTLHKPIPIILQPNED